MHGHHVFMFVVVLWTRVLVFPTCVCAKLLRTLCDRMDCNPPGSSIHGILQATILEWRIRQGV